MPRDLAEYISLLHPGDREAFQEAAEQLASSARFAMEYRLRRREGGYSVIQDDGKVVTSDNGHSTRLIGLLKDITVRKRAEEQLRESEARYRALVEASAAIVWQTDPDGAVIFADNAWNVVTGQTDEQKGGWGWLDVIHPDDLSRTIALWKHSLETRTVHVNKFRVRTQSGDYRWFSVRGVPIFNSDGSVHVWVGANTDIHDEMISEIAMRESEERLNGILRQSPAGIVQTDDTGRMTLVNPRWCEMLPICCQEFSRCSRRWIGR
jgi:PAS domain S-box-containing protein